MTGYGWRLFCLSTAVTLLLGAANGNAADKCKVKIDKKDGTILVSAMNVGGTLSWGDEAGSENTAFSNDAECVADGKASKCRLGETAETGRITPPALCTLYVADSGGDSCSVYVKGCTPAVRSLPAQDVFSAWVAAGAVSNENTEWLDGDCTNPSAGRYVCNVDAGVFSTTPNCVVAAASITRRAQFYAQSSSGTVLDIRLSDTGGAGNDGNFSIVCQATP